ncbi:MAG: hypothetical protein ACPHID_05470 [Thermoplasmatota archaeon]
MVLKSWILAAVLVLGAANATSIPPTLEPNVALNVHDSPEATEAESDQQTHQISVLSAKKTQGRLQFEVPDGDFLKVTVTQHDHTKYNFAGAFTTTLHAPSGATKAFMDGDGAGYTTPVGGGGYVGSSLGVSKYLPYEPGIWSMDYTVQGTLELGFEVRVS